MALNYSQRPIFPAHTSEDNLVSPLRNVNGYVMEGMPERGEGFGRPRYVNNRELIDCFDYGRDIVDRGCSPGSVSNEIIDRLPLDPFGMNFISELIENMEVRYERQWRNIGYEWHWGNIFGNTEDGYGLFTGLNMFQNSVRVQSFPGGSAFDDNSAAVLGSNQNAQGAVLGDDTEEVFSSDTGNVITLTSNSEEPPETSGSSNEDNIALHNHNVFLSVLSQLGLRDLINMERVCQSLRSTVRTEPLLWRNVHIDKNDRITDDVLFQLTSRAQGNLQSLSLVECSRITDEGLKRVLETNLKLKKLCVPGCPRLTIDGIISMLKAFNDASTSKIQNLRVGGFFGVTLEHFEVLKDLLPEDSGVQCKVLKPHFYSRWNLYLLCDDERTIDLEICPKCEKLRIVYDCPAEGCQTNDESGDVCRACILCIARCAVCGRCIKNDSVHEETFCMDLKCEGCMSKWPSEGDLGGRDDVCEPGCDCFLHG